MNLGFTCKKAMAEARDFFFPNLCLCCHEIMQGPAKLFCQKCLHHLFISLPTFSLKGCFPYTEIIVTLDHPYLTSILIKQAKQRTSLYQGLASLMILQLQKIECSTFDVVMPAASTKRLFSHQPSFFLARYLAEMLDASCMKIKDKDPIKDKIVLIVDEKFNIDNLKEIGKEVVERNPRMVFAVTLSR